MLGLSAIYLLWGHTMQDINNRYQMIDQLGSGGMGTVYRVKDRLNGEVVALKQVNVSGKHLLSNITTTTTNKTANLRMVLAQEFRTLASLRHRHIVSVLDYGFDADGQPYFTMELLSNAKTLVAYGKDKPLETQVDLILQMLQALAYLHQSDMIHRDIKPANVLVTEDGIVKMLDFGLAVEAGSPTDIVGTLAYIAPEVLQGKGISIASDLYAVGMMAYEMFAGQHPFNLSSNTQLLAQILSQVPPTLTELSDYGELNEILERLLAKNPVERFQNARDVIIGLCHAVGRSMPEEDDDIRESFLQAARFVGRHKELSLMEEALQGVLSGYGSAWLIGGESGVGKSRLMDEVRIMALVHGAIVLKGQAAERRRAPYHLWVDALRRLVLSTEVLSLEASVLKRIIPDIEDLLGYAVEDAPEIDRVSEQQRIIAAIVNLLRKQSQPVVLLLEDLQWSQESLEPVRQLVRDLHDKPLLIIGNYRDDEAPDLPKLVPEMEIIKLERLSDEEIAELSEVMIGPDGRKPHILELLREETEGNTFFLVEVVRALAQTAGGLSNISQVTLPSTIFARGIRKIVRRRIERLRATDIHYLQLAAVLGRQIDRRIMRGLIQQTDLDSWLLRCTEAAILEFADENWRFTHDKLREGVLEDIEPSILPDLHHQLAQMIENVYPDDNRWAAVLVDHYRAAGNTEKEAQYAVIAGQMAVSLSEYGEARRLCEGLLQVLPPDDVQTRLKLLHILASTHFYQSRYEESESYYQQALNLARDAGDSLMQATAHQGLGRLYRQQGQYAAAEVQFYTGKQLYRDIYNRVGIARSLTDLGSVACYQADYDAAGAYYNESLQMARKLKNSVSIAENLSGLSWVEWSKRNHQVAITYSKQALNIWKRLEDRYNTIGSYADIGRAARDMGDFKTAESYLISGLTVAREIGDQEGICRLLGELGLLSIYEDNYEAAIDFLEEALMLSRVIKYPRFVAYSLSRLGWIAMLRGHHGEANVYFSDSLNILREIGERRQLAFCLCGIGLTQIALNDERSAVQTLKEALRIAQKIQAEEWVALALIGFAELALMRDNATEAVEILTMIETSSVHHQHDVAPQFTRLQARLAPLLSDHTMNLAQRTGKAKNMRQVIRQLLE